MRSFIPVILWALIILGLSITPSSELPDPNIRFADKWAHFLVYGILSFLLIKNSKKYLQTAQISFRLWSVLFLLSTSYGIIIEVIQHYLIPSRFGEWQDALANCVGALLGMVIGQIRFKQDHSA